MIVVGLTGGIASGKSTVSKHMGEIGIPIFDADAVAHEVVAKGTPGLQKVIEIFGEEYLCDGELDRKKMAETVFHDNNKLKQLEEIVQSLVWQQATEFFEKQKTSGVRAVALDVPLLIETGWYKKVDEVWLVRISAEEQVRRVMLRDKCTEEHAKARIASQMSTDKKQTYAKIVIDNSGTVEQTLSQVDKEVKELLVRVNN